MLNALRFNMSIPTPFVFVRRFLKAAESDKKVLYLPLPLSSSLRACVCVCFVSFLLWLVDDSLPVHAAVGNGGFLFGRVVLGGISDAEVSAIASGFRCNIRGAAPSQTISAVEQDSQCSFDLFRRATSVSCSIFLG